MPDTEYHFIITFFSHYDAMQYKKKCDKFQIAAKLMPVPRTLSSSCGTCVAASALLPGLLEDISALAETEQIFTQDIYEENGKTQKRYELIYS